jgi:hypothetical protein
MHLEVSNLSEGLCGFLRLAILYEFLGALGGSSSIEEPSETCISARSFDESRGNSAQLEGIHQRFRRIGLLERLLNSTVWFLLDLT